VLYGGGLLALTIVGLPLVGVSVLGGRVLGRAQRAVVHGLLGEEIPAPSPFRGKPGFFRFIGSMLTDTTGWRALAYNVLKFPVAVVGGYAVAMWVAIAATCAGYPILWAAFEPKNTDAQGRVRTSGMQIGDWYADTLPRALLVCIVGVAMLLASPWLVRLVVLCDRSLAQWLISRSARDVEVAHLRDARTLAVVDADERLRRIERDLHDGAQARMAAVAMSLGQVQEDLADPDVPLDRERVRRLVDAAHANSMTAIGELRDLARGIHPPVLDVGLGPALADLAATSAAAVELRLPPGEPRFAAEIESIAWFCAAELMANVARHSGARRAVIDLAVVDSDLRLRVTDDGHGGAAAAPGSGLSGLADRLAPVDGRLTVMSPLGGPTAVTVEIPLRGDHHVAVL
jgi:signal transduction histidine kinase